MSDEYNSFFMLHESAPQDLLAALSRLMDANSSYPCKIVESGHPYYLHVEVQMKNDPSLRGTLLIPHQHVALAGTNHTDKILGFVRQEG
jgi:hypothetical protein